MSEVVTHTAKVLKFKQITTPFRDFFREQRLLLILQRYSNLSKSQRGKLFDGKSMVVTHTAKVLKFKQITTSRSTYRCAGRLLLILQRYSNLSKSQRFFRASPSTKVVTHTAKVLKFKQITTLLSARHGHGLLLLILQRYSNLSKSQLAIPSTCRGPHVVTHTAKVLKFKQITTISFAPRPKPALLLILQRYSNLSKSQPIMKLRMKKISCYSYCKGTQI